MSKMRTFREWLAEKELNEAKTASSDFKQQLAKSGVKDAKDDRKRELASKKIVKVKIDRKFKFELPKNLIDDRDIIGTDIETSQIKGIKAYKLSDDEYVIMGKRFDYRCPSKYIEEI